jgi:hypothetical protein
MSCGVSDSQNIPSGLSVTLALYDPVTGAKLKDATSLNFGKAQGGESTDVAVIRMFVNRALQIQNVKLGVVAASPQLPGGSGTAASDGSVAAGNFGIEHSNSFSARTSLSSFFEGVNVSGLSSGEYNVSIETRSENSSEYVYLNVKTPAAITQGYVRYKWFFEFT